MARRVRIKFTETILEPPLKVVNLVMEGARGMAAT